MAGDTSARRVVQPQRYTADMYAPIAHLIGDGSPATTLAAGLVPDWAAPIDGRRLLAYRALAALRDNARRFWLPPNLWQSPPVTLTGTGAVVDGGRSAAEQYREYGDAGVLVDTARALVLGDDQTIVVPAAAELPELAQGTTADEARRTAEAGRAFAAEVADFLERWAARDGLPVKLLEAEETTISQGDSVLVLEWSASSRRPRLRVYDGGFYFPDLDAADEPYYRNAGWDDDDFPPRLDLAWEIADPADESITWLVRHRYELRLIGDPDPVTGAFQTHTYPWGGQSIWRCTYRAERWRLDRLKSGRKLARLEVGGADGGETITDLVELGVDFIPAVHLPNDHPGSRNFGRSLFLRIAQILDDLGGGDTDLAISAETVASAALVTTGVGGLDAEGTAAAHFELPTGATAGLIDTATSLDALIKYGAGLLERLSVNARLGGALLGRVRPNEVPSGYALRLGFAPAQRLLKEMRLVRDMKYPLLLRMAVRLAQAGGVLRAGPTPEILLELGAALPADRAATIEEVRVLLSATPPAISTLTAVRLLIAAGLPIEDAEEEVRRIRAEDAAGADHIVNATGNVDDAYAWLAGDPVVAPVEQLPPPVLP